MFSFWIFIKLHFAFSTFRKVFVSDIVSVREHRTEGSILYKKADIIKFPCLLPLSLPPSPANTFYESRLEQTSSRLFQSLAFNIKIFAPPPTLASRKTLSLRLVRPPHHHPLTLPCFYFLFPFLSLSSLSLSFCLSPHPSPPLLRVSGRLFFLCLLLMKGRTKLPSLCPCVVGKITSVFVTFFSFHLSVAASVLHVSSQSAGLRELCGLRLAVRHRTRSSSAPESEDKSEFYFPLFLARKKLCLGLIIPLYVLRMNMARFMCLCTREQGGLENA